MALQITTEQKVLLHGQPVTVGGNPAPADGPLVWSVPDGSVVTLRPSDDGTSCDVISVAVGTVTVTAATTAYGSPISGTFDIEVIAPVAAGVAIVADAPVLKA